MYPEGDVHVCGPPPELAGVDLEARLSPGQWAQAECVRCGTSLAGVAEEGTRALGPVFDRVGRAFTLRACAPGCGGVGR
ncbi:hypothetical protein RM780_07580 [Streptomyces sp. DSM 44917]|uniref:Uncharacterized protein n=1 Tax=Streptomyces boetiae TaxID=3075541 RepID=A0ABU2L5P4_9ACTN|nr:hypothetical protein [Streptomyces sp. DSM 44917]MDT0306822.1 hypothetical protein [Streptomyces sp. DSM 44917]